MKSRSDYVLGLRMMIALHSIENMYTTPELLAQFERFEREQLSPADRRAVLAKLVADPDNSVDQSQTSSDPYCYSNSQVLVNRFELADEEDSLYAETVYVTQRGLEPLPTGTLDALHYRAIHRHLFQDVYAWAGKIRTVRISKGDTLFCLPEFIDEQLEQCFARLRDANFLMGLSADDFAYGAAGFLADLNAIHPFREGNGRTQHAFLAMLSDHAGYRMVFPESQAELDAFKMAVIASFSGSSEPLVAAIRRLIVVD